MGNTVIVSFDNAGTSAHYCVNNSALAGEMGVLNVLGGAAVSKNVSGGAVDPSTFVDATEYTQPGGGTVAGEYATGSSSTLDEAYRFVAEGWNRVKNIAVTAEGDDSILFIADNFVHADLDFSGINNEVVLKILDGKRGNYLTGDGDDTVEITTATNNSGWSNLHNVHTGDGDDIVIIKAGDSSLIGSTIVNYTDGRFTTVDADLGNGNDVYQSGAAVKTMDHVHGGAGNDVIITGGGDDILYGGTDHGVVVQLDDALYELLAQGDKLYGGEGDDTFVYQGADDFAILGDGFDHIVDFEDGDMLELLLQPGDNVETELCTVQTSGGNLTGTMVSINDVPSVFLQDYTNQSEIFV
ncbi:MAG: hypothetical protein EOM26_07135 [Alphaproteobacteria bacterium]|nr:hypothetical protein [Alphaproteobacteria bacterium]